MAILTATPAHDTEVLSGYLADHASNTLGPPPWEEMEGWGHIGAVLSDAGLQAGVKYERVVRPRIERLIAEHPEASTTSGFQDAIAAHGLGALLHWKEGARKLRTIQELTDLLTDQGVETVDDLRSWLKDSGTRNQLMAVYGVKHKTADYLCLLAGLSSVAVDRQLRAFLAEALVGGYEYDGVSVADRVAASTLSYEQVAELYRNAAVLLEVSFGALDHRVWLYESGNLIPQAG